MVAWLVSRVSSLELARATARLNLPLLLPLTVFLVVALYLWDSWCVKWMFDEPGAAVSYSVAVHARGTSYLAGAINYGLCQGILAWMMAKAQRITLVSALGRFALLAYHDVIVLLGLGLLGSFASAQARFQKTEVFCAAGLAVMGGLVAFVRLMPVGWRNRVNETRWGA